VLFKHATWFCVIFVDTDTEGKAAGGLPGGQDPLGKRPRECSRRSLPLRQATPTNASSSNTNSGISSRITPWAN